MMSEPDSPVSKLQQPEPQWSMEVHVSSPDRYQPSDDSDAEREEGPSGPEEEAPSQGGCFSFLRPPTVAAHLVRHGHFAWHQMMAQNIELKQCQILCIRFDRRAYEVGRLEIKKIGYRGSIYEAPLCAHRPFIRQPILTSKTNNLETFRMLLQSRALFPPIEPQLLKVAKNTVTP
jgi:hypothetical protein